jgi:hypothetical protein
MSDLLNDYEPTPQIGGVDNRRLSPDFASEKEADKTIFPPIRTKDYGFFHRPVMPEPPFWPFLNVKSGGTFEVSFAQGYVVERLVKTQTGTNQIKFHEPSNRLDGSDPRLFPITVDQAAYVEFNVSISGEVTGNPTIVIDDDDIAVTRYYPLIGEYAGQAGKFSYKLCSLINDAGTAKLKLYLSGDNVHHLIERFSMISLQNVTGEFYDVLKTYDPDTDEVHFRSLEQLGGSGVGVISPPASDRTIPFRRVKQRDSSPQVEVSQEGDAILVEGNGKNGSLVWYDCDGVATTLLQWEDGLITTEAESLPISFQAGCVTLTPTETPTELPP